MGFDAVHLGSVKSFYDREYFSGAETTLICDAITYSPTLWLYYMYATVRGRGFYGWDQSRSRQALVVMQTGPLPQSLAARLPKINPSLRSTRNVEVYWNHLHMVDIRPSGYVVWRSHLLQEKQYVLTGFPHEHDSLETFIINL